MTWLANLFKCFTFYINIFEVQSQLSYRFNFSRILVDLKIKQSNHNFLYIFQMLSKIKWRRPGCFNQWKRRFNSHSWSSSEFHPSFKWTSFRATHPCRPTGKKLYHNQMLNYKNLTTNLVYRYTTIMIIIIHVDSLIHSC